MRAHWFKIVAERQENGFRAYCPALKDLDVVSEGATESEAIFKVNALIERAIEKLHAEGKTIDDIYADDSALTSDRGSLTVIEDQEIWTQEDFERLGLPTSVGVKKPAPPPKKKK